MKIDIHNFEEFIPDYLDGNLNPGLKRELESLFLVYPHLKNLLEDIETARLEPEKLEFRNKSVLKKTVSDFIPLRFNNYEEFFIAKTEGELSQDEEKALKLFLENNPSKQKELDYFLNSRLIPDEIIFTEKKSLRKSVPLILPSGFSTIDEFLVARLEGELTLAEEKAFFSLVQNHPELEKEYSLFELSKLSTEKQIIFEDKSSLKKSLPIAGSLRRILYYSVSVAASLLFILLFVLNANHRGNNLQEVIASSKSPVKKNRDNSVMNHEKTPGNFTDEQKEINENNPGKADRIDEEKTDPVVAVANEGQYANISELRNYVKYQMSGLPEMVYNSLENEEKNSNKKDYTFQVIKNSRFMRTASPKTITNHQNTESSKEKTAKTENYMSPNQYVTKSLRKNVLKLDKETPAGKISFWDLAQATVNGFKKVTGKDVDMVQKYDNQGKVVRLAFSSQVFAISAPLRK